MISSISSISNLQTGYENTPSTFSKIQKISDLLSYLFSYLHWHERREIKATCKDFKFSADKSVLNKIIQCKHLNSKLFESALLWFIPKNTKYYKILEEGEKEIEEYLKTCNFSVEKAEQGDYFFKSIDVKEIDFIKYLRPYITQVIQNTPNVNVMTIDNYGQMEVEDYQEYLTYKHNIEDYARKILNEKLIAEIVNISNQFHKNITSLKCLTACLFDPFLSKEIYPNLTHLNVSINFWKDSEEGIDNSQLMTSASSFANRFKNLKKLTLGLYETGLEIEHVIDLHKRFPRLTHVIGDNNGPVFHYSALKTLDRLFPNLKQCCFTMPLTAKELEVFTDVIKNCFKNIKKLSFFSNVTMKLNYHWQEYDSILKTNSHHILPLVSENFKKLTHVKFMYDINVIPNLFIDFCKNLPELTHFTNETNPFKEDEIFELIKVSPKLKFIKFGTYVPGKTETWDQQKIIEVRKQLFELNAQSSNNDKKRTFQNLDEEEKFMKKQYKK